MAELCSCDTGILNHGQPNCVDSFARDARLIFVQYQDDSGNVNSITQAEFTAGMDQTFLDARFNGAADIRWHLTPTVNSVEGARAESVKQDIDGIPFNVRQGIRTYNGTFYGTVAATQYVNVLKSMSCQNIGMFIIDVSGNIIGMNNEVTGDLDPIKVQRNTLDVIYKFPSSSEVQAINLMFAYEENEQDGDLRYIKSSDITADMLTQSAMTTVVLGTATSISTAGFTTAITYTYGAQFNAEPYEGAVVGDFTATEISPTPGAVALTSATESPVGTYAIVFTSPATSGDVIELSYSVTTGAGFESIVNLSVTIP